jgi:hypothetical protein
MISTAVRLLAVFVLASVWVGAVAQGTPVAPIAPEVPNPSLAHEPPAVKSVPASPADVPERTTPVQRVADIALVLPLAAPDYARAAEAVRDGFTAAAEAAGFVSRTRVIGHEDGGIAGAFEAAKKLGVRIVVGPLVRDDLRAIVSSAAPDLPVTVALNQLDDGNALPPTMYTLALSIEADARLLARRMRADQVASVAIIGGGGPLEKRFATSFTDAWIQAGGGPPEVFRFDLVPDALGILRRDLAKSTAQAALVTSSGAQAALARSFAPRLPAYATSLVNEPMEASAQRDLEGVVFVDVPWLVRAGDPAFERVPRRDYANNALQRLYALGLDAFAVARAFVDGVPERLELPGATGTLTLGEGRVIAREGAFAVFRRGQVVPWDGTR